jgi:hypothetical protein
LNFGGITNICDDFIAFVRKVGRLRFGSIASLCAVATTLSACSGALGGGPSTTQIVTEPAGSLCTLTGKGYEVRLTAPLKTKLPKNAAPIKLSCTAAGHRTFVTILKPVFNDKVLHNFLLGSSMGMAVDMMNGNYEKYPRRVVLHLEPKSFSDVTARDIWYARYRQYIEFKWRRILDDIQAECSDGSGENGNCKDAVMKVEASREQELQRLEQRRRRAALVPTSNSQTSTLSVLQ